MVVSDVAAEVEFLRSVFDATGEVHTDRPAEIRIGDSLVMVTLAGEREQFPAFLYVYVDDADAAYRRALDAGARSIEEPLDTPYGDRRAMVRDPLGNVFQVAHRQSDGAYKYSVVKRPQTGTDRVILGALAPTSVAPN
jgi:PhnB protein